LESAQRADAVESVSGYFEYHSGRRTLLPRRLAPFGPLDVVLLANEKGEVGYAWGGENQQLPAVREAEARGWITWAYDASPGGDYPSPRERRDKRDVYRLTPAGYAARSVSMCFAVG
jgi:hypothetical protein